MRTHNFGDICILDRDEEFRDGCLALLSNPDLPDYVAMDLACVRYGSVSFDSSVAFPKFEFDDIPTIILYGSEVVNSRNLKEDCHDVPSYDIDLTDFSDSSDTIYPPGFFDDFESDDDGDFDSFDPPSGLSYDFDEEVDF